MHREIARAAKGCTLTELSARFGVIKDVARRACARCGTRPPRPIHRSVAARVLNALDFTSFPNQFAAIDPHSSCDGSANTPVLDVLDFGCLLIRLAAGCP